MKYPLNCKVPFSILLCTCGVVTNIQRLVRCYHTITPFNVNCLYSAISIYLAIVNIFP